MSGSRGFLRHVPVIARALGMRLSRTRVPAAARTLIYDALALARDGELVDLKGRLAEAARTIPAPDQRGYFVALFLLDFAWMIRPDSAPAGEVKRLFRWYYSAAERENRPLWRFLRDETLERSWSSFPLVRQMAALVRGNDPVDPEEQALLLDDLIPLDIRSRIAERLLTVGERVQLPAVFEYLQQLHQRAHAAAETRGALGDLVESLKHSCHRQEVFDALYQAFIRHAHDSEFSGRLQDIVAKHGVDSVPVLVQDARDHPDKAQAIGRILEHMLVHYQSEVAGHALCDLVLAADDRHLRYHLAQKFVEAAQELSARANSPSRLREVFRAAAVRFREADGPLARKAEELEDAVESWSRELSEQEMADHLAQRVMLTPKQVRNAGLRAFNALRGYVTDTDQPQPLRVRAIHTATEMRAAFLTRPLQTLFWEVFWADTDDEIRAAALRGVVRKRRPISPAEKDDLFRVKSDAPPDSELRRTFEDPGIISHLFGDTAIGSSDPPSASPPAAP